MATLFLAAAAWSASAGAVPIPWKNCGAAGDILSVSQSDASTWPPPVAAPASATATFDSAGDLINLRLSLIHGPEWAFDSGPLPTSTSGGFVTLPASFAVSVAAPPLPLAPGPVTTMRAFGPPPWTMISQANVGASVDPPVATTVSLMTNGAPGFPLSPSAGDVFAIRVDMRESGGARVFCMDVSEPFKEATTYVSVHTVPGVPALTWGGTLLLVVALVAAGLLAARRRSGHNRPRQAR